MSAGAVIVAAGAGARIGGVPKPWRLLDGVPLLAWALESFRRSPEVGEIVVVVSPDVAEKPPPWLRARVDRVVEGGETRRASVGRGLAALGASTGIALVHDGARPFVSVELVERVWRAAAEGPAIPGLSLPDTVKLIEPGGRVLSTLDRERLRRVQTPQGFPYALVRDLHIRAERESVEAPDDAFLCEREGIPVRLVDGEVWNFKVTTMADLALASWLAESGTAERAGAARPASVPDAGRLAGEEAR